MNEDNQIKTVKILALYPDGTVRDHELSVAPTQGSRITLGYREWRVTEARESVVHVGSHSVFPQIGWDMVIRLS